jgi:predicted Zn-dependent peptidase
LIFKKELSNGLRLLYEQVPSVRSVAIGIWIGTGSKNEGKANNGISHFVEHMLFKGTTKYSAKAIAEVFDRIGGHINAFTSKEYTCYHAKVLDEHIEIALDLLSDMFFNSIFDPGEIEKEKNVVIEEIKMSMDTPDDLVHDLLAQSSFAEHSIGLPILGSEEVLRRLTQKDLTQYVHDYYTVDKTVIAIAGHVPDNVVELVEKRFSSFKRLTKATKEANPVFTNGTALIEKPTEQAHFCIGFPGLLANHPDIYSLILLNNVLGGSMSSRLFQEIREERGLAYSVFSYHTSYTETGMLAIYAGCAPEQVNEVTRLITEMLRDFRKNGITKEELKKGREQLKGNLVLGLESTNSLMSRLGRNELIAGEHLSLEEVLAKIEQVTLESVQRVNEQIFTAKPSFAMVAPDIQIPDSIAHYE